MLIIYFDTSALVKKYVKELGSKQIGEFYSRADIAGTVMVTQVEMASALSRAMRMEKIKAEESKQAWSMFVEDWDTFYLIGVTKSLVSRASLLAWEEELRGYDAVHLASLLAWKDTIGLDITLATFDVKMWGAAKRLKIEVIPNDLPKIIESSLS